MLEKKDFHFKAIRLEDTWYVAARAINEQNAKARLKRAIESFYIDTTVDLFPCTKEEYEKGLNYDGLDDRDYYKKDNPLF